MREVVQPMGGANRSVGKGRPMGRSGQQNEPIPTAGERADREVIVEVEVVNPPVGRATEPRQPARESQPEPASAKARPDDPANQPIGGDGQPSQPIGTEG